MGEKLQNFEEMEAMVLRGGRQKIAVAAAQSEEVLIAVEYARQKGIIDALLIGDNQIIEEICQKNGIPLSKYEVEEVKEPQAAAIQAVTAVREGRAQLLMKGLIETGDFLKAVLNREAGIRSEKRLCSVVAVESRAISRLLVLADVGTNIAPDIDVKKGILENCMEAAQAMGIDRPKAAVLCAHEQVKEKDMPATVQAALLSKMNERGQYGKRGIVEGPISMDIAVSPHAAEIKSFQGKIKGDADILLVPELEAGNILIKGLMYLSNDIRVAGVGMGAKVPLILTSRGDDHDTKYYSIVLSCLISQYMQV